MRTVFDIRDENRELLRLIRDRQPRTFPELAELSGPLYGNGQIAHDEAHVMHRARHA